VGGTRNSRLAPAKRSEPVNYKRVRGIKKEKKSSSLKVKSTAKAAGKRGDLGRKDGGGERMGKGRNGEKRGGQGGKRGQEGKERGGKSSKGYLLSTTKAKSVGVLFVLKGSEKKDKKRD